MLFVYVDFADDGRPFYVGQGTAARVKCLKRNIYHDRVAAKYGCHRFVALETSERFEALNRELRLIAELHTFIGDPCWNEVGTNLTSGGDGGDPGIARAAARKMWSDPYSRAKITLGIRRSWFGNRNRQLRVSKAIKRYRARHDVKLARRLMMLKRWQDPAYSEARAESMRMSWRDDATRAKITAGIRHAKSTPEAKAWLATRNKAAWESSSEEQRNAILLRLRNGRRKKFAAKLAEKANDPQHTKMKYSTLPESARKSWADPEKRARRIEGMKLAWKRRKQQLATHEHTEHAR